ncbi:hypothetical protein TNIN_435381 [Trichonephila inaurata madagascariensis]|uniref:Uncharacterized protein n=1 Tax=Trichonephila inaurata madagascariensis TaxID=2747483 RepID=A0A8X6J770_9ARAC|nr:hypothetical protein TNIN_435381 [Trichonephila inaurata madagascariensis]
MQTPSLRHWDISSQGGPRYLRTPWDHIARAISRSHMSPLTVIRWMAPSSPVLTPAPGLTISRFGTPPTYKLCSRFNSVREACE